MSKPLVNALQRFNSAGGLLAGGKLFSYAAGTSAPQATYTDQTAGTPNANPTILDSNGHANIWITNAGYKFQLQNSLGVVIWTVDNVYLIEPNSIGPAQIAAGAVGTAQLASNPVGTAQIPIGSITTLLLAPGAVTTAKIAVGNVKFNNISPTIDLTLLNNVAGVVERRADDLSGGKILSYPQYPWSTPSKLSNPGTLPAAAANDAKWSPDGRFLAVGHATTPFVTIYERAGGNLNKLPNPVTLPPNTVHGLAWSPNGDFLICTHTGSPFITIYQRQGINFTKLSDPSTIPSSNAFGVAFSPNGEFLIVTSSITNFNLYQILGTTFTDISATCGIFGGGLGTSVAWSADSQYVAISNQFTNGVYVYQRFGSSFTNITPVLTNLLPAGFPTGLAWSPDGQFLAIATLVSPYIAIYQFGGGVFTLIATPATIPSGAAGGVTWSSDGLSLAVAFTSSPFILVYTRSGTTFTANANPVSLPAGNGSGISFSPSSQFLSVAVATTPFVNTYSTAGTFPAKATLYSRNFLDV